LLFVSFVPGFVTFVVRRVRDLAAFMAFTYVSPGRGGPRCSFAMGVCSDSGSWRATDAGDHHGYGPVHPYV